MFDKHNVLNGVTSNFEGGMGSTDLSNASVEAVQTNRKRKLYTETAPTTAQQLSAISAIGESLKPSKERDIVIFKS